MIALITHKSQSINEVCKYVDFERHTIGVKHSWRSETTTIVQWTSGCKSGTDLAKDMN